MLKRTAQFGGNCAARTRAFTLVELLVVITIIGVIAGMLLTAGPGMMDRRNEARVKGEIKKLETAIVDYKNLYGTYPPDNTNALGLSPLFYELAGVELLPNPAPANVPPANVNWQYRSLADNSIILPNVFTNTFFVGGVMNVTHGQTRAKSFIPIKESERAEFFDISGNAYKVLVVPAKGTRQSSVTNNGRVYNLWRYVSSNPTNRPGEFDLWAEILKGSSQTKIIGNWQR